MAVMARQVSKKIKTNNRIMITIKTPMGWSFCCMYLEDIADRLTKVYGREVLVSDYESQLESHDCDFIVFGDKYHYKQD